MGFVTNWEDDLIDPKYWKELYNEMPKECQRLIDDHEEGVGIGRNDQLGWFTAFCGQGPVLNWNEKKSPGSTVENKKLSWSGAYKSYVKRSFVIGRFKYTLKKNVTEELIFSSDHLIPLRNDVILTFLRTNSYIKTAQLMDISIYVLKEKILNSIRSIKVRSLYLKRELFRSDINSGNHNLKIYKARVSEYNKPLVDEFRCNIKGYQNKMKKFLNPLKKDVMKLILETNSYSETAKILNIPSKKVRNELVEIIKLLKKVKKTSWIYPHTLKGV